MKSLTQYSLNIPEEQYHDYPAWSYSMIANYAKNGFEAIAHLHDKTTPTPAMEFGFLFDSILTKGVGTLDDYVVDDTKVEPAEKEVFDTLISEGFDMEFSQIPTEDLDRVIDMCATFSSKYKKPETRYSKLKAVESYFNTRRLGKKVVSSNDWNDAIQMAKVFRKDSYLKDLFGTKNNKDTEYIYQAQFVRKFNIDGEDVDVKCMPDLIVVNHKDKTIQPVDLKTSSIPAYQFAENFIKLKYYLQAELYTDVITDIVENDDEYSSYTILPYLFTDISRTDKIPVTYLYEPRNGFSYSKFGNEYSSKGWKELLAEILVYEANESKVPNYITTEGPNDIINIISTTKVF